MDKKTIVVIAAIIVAFLGVIVYQQYAWHDKCEKAEKVYYKQRQIKGYEEGTAAGYAEGHDTRYQEGYDDGYAKKKAEIKTAASSSGSSPSGSTSSSGNTNSNSGDSYERYHYDSGASYKYNP